MNEPLAAKQTSVTLTDAELVILDGRCSEKVQAEVTRAARRLSFGARLACDPRIAAFVADVVNEAEAEGLLVFRHTGLRSCFVCHVDPGYYPHKRSGRFHRAGEPNHDKPRSLNGVELAHRFVVMRGHASCGCCSDCWKLAAPFVVEALVDVRAQIPEAIMGRPPRWQKFDRRKCSACGWMGHEGEMRRLSAIMGGTYAGGCPACPADNKPFGPTSIVSVAGFDVVAMAPSSAASAPSAGSP